MVLQFIEFKPTSGKYTNTSNDYVLVLRCDIGANTLASADPNIFQVLDGSGNVLNIMSVLQVASGAATPVDGFIMIQQTRPILLAPGWSLKNLNAGTFSWGYGLQGTLEDLRGYF